MSSSTCCSGPAATDGTLSGEPTGDAGGEEENVRTPKLSLPTVSAPEELQSALKKVLDGVFFQTCVGLL